MKKTAKDRFSRALRRIREWCRWNRHVDVEVQHRALSAKLNGHYSYFGVTGNYRMIARLHYETARAWHKWLSRRSQRATLNWEQMGALLQHHPLPKPRIVHQYA
jgi:RNA-directed DNA polymerase